ncbi:MAG: creatininase family protein [Rubellimicrobium sp.]|nr:creatininase family protein [Rubellimicrobium sp.]
MKIAEMNWLDVEAAAKRDPRAVLPIGSTEQHGHLSLCVDAILAERVAVEAADPLGVPVFPVISYGLAPYFTAYPGTVSLRVETLLALVRDVIASIRASGFTRILIVNGHGGNAPVGALAQEINAGGGVSVKFHNWWNAPRTAEYVREIGPGSHASWMENFPWTRLAHAPAPEGDKPMADMDLLRSGSAAQIRAHLGEGNLGGLFQRDDEVMLEMWRRGVEETREALEGPWPPA